jgi:hypothetical protein
MNLCKDCRYFTADALTAGHEAECSAPGNAEVDYVNGGLKPIYRSAGALRDTTEKYCGVSGKWFEARIQEAVA